MTNAATALPLVVTDAGREAAINAHDDGLQLKLTEMALGDGLWSPDGTATALQNEIKRIDNLGGTLTEPDMLHVTITDDSSDAYSLGEFGLYTEDGILFAIYSQRTIIAEKIAESILMLSADMKLDTVPASSVTVEGNNFYYPLATDSIPGVMTEAPDDGLPYVRQSKSWESLIYFHPGMIMMWAGEINQIPSGWQLCNGSGKTTNNINVPNLLNRMIICAGDTYEVNEIGGNTSVTSSDSGSHSHTATIDSNGSHSHSITVQSTTLTESQIPQHYHLLFKDTESVSIPSVTLSSSNYPRTYTEKNNDWSSKIMGSDTVSNVGRSTVVGNSNSHNHSSSSESSGSHTHQSSISLVNDHNHSVTTMPPYFSLAYIIKL